MARVIAIADEKMPHPTHSTVAPNRGSSHQMTGMPARIQIQPRPKRYEQIRDRHATVLITSDSFIVPNGIGNRNSALVADWRPAEDYHLEDTSQS